MPLKPQQFPATTVPTRFIGGRITTEDPAQPEADALVTDATGRIAWIGWANELPAAFAGDAYEEVDLGGARVIPGFVDAHMHAVMLANFAPQISVLPPNITSIAELTEAIRARRAAQGPNAWVEGWGYDEALLAEQRSPTRWDLDAGSPDAPVCIMRTCGHIRCVNSRALEIAGITRDTPDPVGGEIERDATGEPTGVLKETARDLVTPFIPKPSEHDAVQHIVDLGQLLASQGIVAATDMCSVDGTDTHPLLLAAARAGFKQDVATYMLWDYIKQNPDAYEPGPKQMDRSQQIFAAGIKIMTDGSVSGRTAWFYDPFLPSERDLGAPNCGMPTCTDDDIDHAIAFCQNHGCQLSLHAMGTHAIDRVIDRVMAAGLWDADGVPPVRIEHVTAPSPHAISAMAANGIAVVTQPIFPYAEIGTYLTNLGEERTRRCYPFRTLVDAGVDVCISTDAPATSWAVPSDPFPNIKSAVTRQAYNHFDFDATEALSVEEVLARYTREPARILGFEGLGMLKAGYKASFAVLDRDILAIPADEIDRVQVAATYICGEKVFER